MKVHPSHQKISSYLTVCQPSKFAFSQPISVRSFSGHAIAQAVNCQFLTVEGLVCEQGSSLRFVVDEMALEQIFLFLSISLVIII
jgi:hypothetical protein